MYKIITHYRFLLFLLLAGIIIIGCFGERITANNQTGWDGKHYAQYAINLPQQLQNGEIDSYHFFRILPSYIVYLLLKLFHIEINIPNIVSAFVVCNAVIILSLAIYYFFFCRHFKIRWHAEITGFAGLFLNFVILKHTWYYPVLTDDFAFACGFIMAGEFLRKRWLTAFIAFVLGTFTYPLFFITSFVLLVTFRSNLITVFISKVFSNAKWILPVLCLLLFAFYEVFGKQVIVPQYYFQLEPLWFYLSVPLLLFYLYKIFDVKLSLEHGAIKKIDEVKVAASILIFVSIYFLMNRLIKNFTIPETDFTPSTFLWNVFQQAIAKPFSFVISHYTYYGPVVLLLMFFYKIWMAEVTKYGWQLLIFVFIYLLLGIGSESRQFINAWPAFVLVFVLAVNQINFSKVQVLIFVLISLFQSHFWLHINRPGIFEASQYDKFPDQLFFMHHGPFASDLSYMINAIVCLVVAVLLWNNIRKSIPALNMS